MREPMFEEETKYWIYVSGVSDAAVLYDRSPEGGGEPVLWLRSGFEKAESAEGLHLGMLFQRLSDGKRCPPDFTFVGTENEALLFIRRDAAVVEFQSLFLIAFDRGHSSDLKSMAVREAEEILGQDGVLARITELGLIPIIRAWIEKMRVANSRGEADVKDFRERIQKEKADKMRELFFGPPTSTTVPSANEEVPATDESEDGDVLPADYHDDESEYDEELSELDELD